MIGHYIGERIVKAMSVEDVEDQDQVKAKLNDAGMLHGCGHGEYVYIAQVCVETRYIVRSWIYLMLTCWQPSSKGPR